MLRFHRGRRIRGLLAATLVAAAVAVLFEHHHIDHDGTLLHMEEDHGSHGEAVAHDVERLPAAYHAAVPTTPVQVVPLPDLLDPVGHGVPVFDSGMRPVGHDPPNARGSRAPPASQPETRRTA